MHHCVGGYDSLCMRGRTQIFSLRTAKGERLSTLELVAREIRPGVFWFTEEQHLAAYNRPPPGEAVAAARQLVSALNSRRALRHVAAALPRRAAVDVHVLCGFDYRSDTAWEQRGPPHAILAVGSATPWGYGVWGERDSFQAKATMRATRAR